MRFKWDNAGKVYNAWQRVITQQKSTWFQALVAQGSTGAQNSQNITLLRVKGNNKNMHKWKENSLMTSERKGTEHKQQLGDEQIFIECPLCAGYCSRWEECNSDQKSSFSHKNYIVIGETDIDKYMLC